MKSFNDRAPKEVEWRRRNFKTITTVARFAGLEPLIVACKLSKRIGGGRRPVRSMNGELIGYG